jgi:hypothetical protein
MGAVQGITFEKDISGVNRYVRIDMLQHAETLRPFMQTLGIIPSFEGWEEGLNSEEFLMEAKQMLRKKFDDRNQVS